MGPTDYWTIGAMLVTSSLSAGISVGVFRAGQADLVRRLGEMKESMDKLDRVKLSKEVHEQIVIRLDRDIKDVEDGVTSVRGEIGAVRGEVGAIRHTVRNLEQRAVFVPPAPRS